MQKVSLVRQGMQSECGISCIVMFTNYYGFEESNSFFREKYNVGRDGLKIKQVVDILGDIGFTMNAFSSPQLEKRHFSKEPTIVYLNTNHFVIVVSEGKKGSIYIYDPATGKNKTSIRELNNMYGGYFIKGKKSDKFVTNKKKIREYRHLIPIIKDVQKLILYMLVFSFLAYIVSIFVPLIMRNVLDVIASDNDVNMTFILLSISISVLVFFISSMIRNNLLVKLQEQLIEKLSFTTIKHLLKVKYSYFENRSAGAVLFRVNVINQFRNAVSIDLVQFIMSFSSTIVILGYLIFNYVYLIIPILICILFFYIFLYKYHDKIAQAKNQELSLYSNIESLTTEIVNNVFQIKCTNLSNVFLLNYLEKFEIYKKQFVVSQKTSQSVSLIVICILTFLPIYFIIGIAQFRQVSVGELFALYSFLSTLFNQVQNLILSFFSYSILKSSFFYLNDLLDEKEQITEGSMHIDTFSELVFDSVNFRYNDITKNILQDINILVRKGEKVALVGPSGSGKTTIVKLLAKLYEPTTGEVRINGLTLEKLSEDVFTNKLSIVPQTPVYFNKSLKENLVLGVNEINEDQAIKALKNAEILKEVNNLPMGLNTVISQSTNFSGGQLQRISIARSLYNEPSLLILDEATSNLDMVNEKNIFDNIKKLGIAQLVITHRLSTVIDADRIYVLDNGKIVETGTHNELLNENGLYCKMFLSNGR